MQKDPIKPFLEEKANEILKKIDEIDERSKKIKDEDTLKDTQLQGLSYNHYLKGIKQYLDDNLEGAINELRNASEIKSLDKDYPFIIAGAYFDYGISYKIESSLEKSVEWFEKAAKLEPDDDTVSFKLGAALQFLAESKKDEILYLQAFKWLKKTVEINPVYLYAYKMWKLGLIVLIKMTGNEKYYEDLFMVFEEIIKLEPGLVDEYLEWGDAINSLALVRKDAELHKESISKSKAASIIDPDNKMIYYNLGVSLGNIAKLNKDDSYTAQCIEMFKKYVDLGGDIYDLSCMYANFERKEDAFKCLKKKLEKDSSVMEKVIKSKFWEQYLNDEEFKKMVAKFDDGLSKLN